MNILLHAVTGKKEFHWLTQLPRQQLNKDWFNEGITPPAEFCVAMDDDSLWFLAARRSAASCHPNACPGTFQEELWKYDVGEWFLYSPESGQYWEFNLSPNGAWWSCGFSAPRLQDPGMAVPSGVETRAEQTSDSWLAMAKIPLHELAPVAKEKDLSLLKMAVTFILESPRQVFLTSAAIDTPDPDFHLPGSYGSLQKS